MRLFVAAPVPEDLRHKISLLVNEISGDGVSLVKSENMHLTLKFMGDVDPQKLEEIKQKLGMIKFSKIECRLRGVGAFPNENYVRVVWVGAESGGKLEALASNVLEAMHDHGKNEPFTAHLTIARLKQKIDLDLFLKKFRNEDFGAFTINKFELIESILSDKGPTYRILAYFETDKKR